MSEVEKFYGLLKKAQEPKGFYFSNDKEMVSSLIQGLLDNKNRYGYMCCPCRLASGDREKDKDITCPCEYRAPDLEEFGACFCGLYISKALHNNEIESEYIPERRPPEKIF